ncbi:MAG: type III pantothenate kinase, partial [Monoglobales bacterium]
MVLTIDIGNTNTVIGGFNNEDIAFVARIATDPKKTEDEYAALIKDIIHLNEVHSSDVENAIFSSVVPPLNKTMQKALQKVFGITPMMVGPGIKTG